MQSAIAIGVLLVLSGCLMDRDYTCIGGAVRGGPDNLCECPEGTVLEESRCVNAKAGVDDGGLASSGDDGDMLDGDQNSCDTCVSVEEAGLPDTFVGSESDADRDSEASPLPPPIRQISAGGAHTCALESTGTVRCWGRNALGQLGDGTQTARSTPTEVIGVSDAVEISAGQDHTCARLSSGAVVCWGANARGQLGDGTTVSRASIESVKGLGSAALLSAGGDQTCAVSGMDAVFCWGHGQSAEPAKKSFPTSNFTEIEAGINHVCVRFRYNVLCWGDTASRALPPSGVVISAVELAAGKSHTCSRDSSNAVHCWGTNESGQLGDGTFDERNIVTAVVGLSDAVELDAGDNHTCARRTSGSVACWGSNLDGQLGNGLNASPSSPVLVSELSEPVAIAAGGNHSCALLSSGIIKCWGANENGQLGDGTKVPRNAPVVVVWMAK